MYRIYLISWINHDDPPANWAERLNDLGRIIQRRVRSGAETEDVADELGLPLECCHLALAFVSASIGLKLEAMFEAWPCERIALELCLSRARARWAWTSCQLIPPS